MKPCERCTALTNLTIMSRFNTEQICLWCETREKAHPDYQAAHDAELTQVKLGNMNFAGVGLPSDLTQPCSAAFYVQHYGLGAIRGTPLNDGEQLVYVSDASLDEAIALWEDEEDDDYRFRMQSKSRLYGSEVYNDNMVCWIYLHTVTVPVGMLPTK